jgi:hypothetical protein
MKNISGRDVVIWAPRIIGLGLAGFLGIFALDSLSGPQGILGTAIAVIMGLLPALIVLGAVIVGWKHAAAACGLFVVLTAVYTLSALSHPDWIALISGPLALEAILFFVSWRFQSTAAQRVT